MHCHLTNNTQVVALLQTAVIYLGPVSKGYFYHNPDVIKHCLLSDHPNFPMKYAMHAVSIWKFPGNKFIIFQLSENKS